MPQVETTEAWSQEEQGFGASDIPPPHAASVRMGVVGGYCLQQISDSHCYFRWGALLLSPDVSSSRGDRIGFGLLFSPKGPRCRQSCVSGGGSVPEPVRSLLFSPEPLLPSPARPRTISNIDMKLELVPAWVINFMSRQLAGSGYKLFQEVPPPSPPSPPTPPTLRA